MDKAGKQYWDKAWEAYDMPQAVNLQDKGLANHVNFRYHETFVSCQAIQTGYMLEAFDIVILFGVPEQNELS